MYDQNRPEEPQRQPGDEQPARRRLGRSWAPAEEAAEADEQAAQPPQGQGQPPEQYRFDPDRGRRHRYSDDPTGQMPNVPVEIAETGPSVPPTRRPNPGEQFEPIPPAPPQPQGQPESPFAPPGANSVPSAPPAPNNVPSAPPPSTNGSVPSAPPGLNNAPSGPPTGAINVPSAPPQPQQPSAPQTPAANEAPGAPQQTPAQNEAPSMPRQQYSAPPNPPSPPRPPAAPTPAPPVEPVDPGPHTGPIPVPEGHPRTAPGAPQTPTPSAPPLPSPPVTEQVQPRTPQISRQPVAEPTPPAMGTEDEQPVPEEEQLLERVRQVPGVRDAYHVTSPDGSTSLRLELEEGVDRDEVHASVSAVLTEERAVDPGPQTADEPGEAAQAEIEAPQQVDAEVPAVGVVELRSVEINSSGMEAAVAVTLAIGDRETSGAVSVPPVDWHVQHAAAAAAVEALRPHLSAAEARVEVEHASVVPTGPVKTAVVVVLWMDGRTVRRLSGATVVTSERTKAVVMATLSALAGEVAQ